MMLALPFVFVTFIINFPAGLIVYWITTNFWTVGQQLFIKRFLPPPEPIAAGAAVPAGARAATDGGKTKDSAKEKKPAKPAKAQASGSNGAEATKAPPPGPRKKKKRSGRRR
jgi:YidC/Oxa1 family membrane protein insertase